MSDEPERLYSAREAAQYLGVALQSIYTATGRGKLAATREHGIMLFRQSDLAAYRDNNQGKRGKPRKAPIYPAKELIV